MPAPNDTPKATARIVRCPQCSGASVYAASNPWRPFCSERCRGLDLGAWASEQFRVEAQAPPDEHPFGDPRTS